MCIYKFFDSSDHFQNLVLFEDRIENQFMNFRTAILRQTHEKPTLLKLFYFPQNLKLLQKPRHLLTTTDNAVGNKYGISNFHSFWYRKGDIFQCGIIFHNL